MRSKKSGSVRIIAGLWRGRRLEIVDVEGLRPSGDRSREVLFNWLQPYLHGARCADLFAGTGVLGLEAVSRGAASAVLIDTSARAVQGLQRSVGMLGASQVRVEQADALAWLQAQPENSLDLVFVDPPFAGTLAQAALADLALLPCLQPGGLVYLETARAAAWQPEPDHFAELKDKQVGDVRMQLLQKC